MKIRWTKKAAKNLEQLENYIARDKPKAAIATIVKILRAVECLAQYPQLGRAGRLHDTRELIIPNLPFIIPYRIKDNYVEILRVLHSTTQWPEKL